MGLHAVIIIRQSLSIIDADWLSLHGCDTYRNYSMHDYNTLILRVGINVMGAIISLGKVKVGKESANDIF